MFPRIGCYSADGKTSTLKHPDYSANGLRTLILNTMFGIIAEFVQPRNNKKSD